MKTASDKPLLFETQFKDSKRNIRNEIYCYLRFLIFDSQKLSNFEFRKDFILITVLNFRKVSTTKRHLFAFFL